MSKEEILKMVEDGFKSRPSLREEMKNLLEEVWNQGYGAGLKRAAQMQTATLDLLRGNTKPFTRKDME